MSRNRWNFCFFHVRVPTPCSWRLGISPSHSLKKVILKKEAWEVSKPPISNMPFTAVSAFIYFLLTLLKVQTPVAFLHDKSQRLKSNVCFLWTPLRGNTSLFCCVHEMADYTWVSSLNTEACCIKIVIQGHRDWVLQAINDFFSWFQAKNVILVIC